MTDSGKRPLSIFLCHSVGDKSEVRKLYERLKADGMAPWLDEENVLPGQDWQIEIKKAVKSADVVIVCLSSGATTKDGYLQREISLALDVTEEKAEGSIFLVPLKFEECVIPDRLNRWQWVNYFDDGGYSRLLRSLSVRSEAIGASKPGIFVSPDAYLSRGNLYFDRGQFDEAIADFSQAIILRQDYAEAFYGRGKVFLDTERLDQAILDFDKALIINSNFALAYNGRGNVYFRRRQFDKAIAEYNLATEADPNYDSPYINRGKIFRKKGEFDLSLNNYNRAIQLDPNSAMSYAERGLTYLDSENFNLAIADFNRAIWLQQDNSYLYFIRGNAYLQNKFYDEAMADYNHLIRFNPEDASAYFNRGLVFHHTNFTKAAIADFKRCLELNTIPEMRLQALEWLHQLGISL